MLRYIKGQDFIASPGNSSRVVIPNGRGRWTPFGSLYAKLVYVLMRDLLLRDLSLESGVRKTTLFIVHPCHHTRGGTWKVEITMGLARIPFVCAERRNVMASLGEMVPILARYSYSSVDLGERPKSLKNRPLETDLGSGTVRSA